MKNRLFELQYPTRYIESLDELCSLLDDECLAMVREEVSRYLPLCKDVNGFRMSAFQGCKFLQHVNLCLKNRRECPNWERMKEKEKGLKEGTTEPAINVGEMCTICLDLINHLLPCHSLEDNMKTVKKCPTQLR